MAFATARTGAAEKQTVRYIIYSRTVWTIWRIDRLLFENWRPPFDPPWKTAKGAFNNTGFKFELRHPTEVAALRVQHRVAVRPGVAGQSAGARKAASCRCGDQNRAAVL